MTSVKRGKGKCYIGWAYKNSGSKWDFKIQNITLHNLFDKTPLKRGVTQEDVAKAALFLCSDLSSGVTGDIVYVDSGYNIMGAITD